MSRERELVSIKNRERVNEIAEGLSSLGFGYIPSENEKQERAERAASGFWSAIRRIVCTPIGIAFHAVAVITNGIGYVASLGLLPGAYYLFLTIADYPKGTPLLEVQTFREAVFFISIPFIAYTISILAEKAQEFFERNAC